MFRLRRKGVLFSLGFLLLQAVFESQAAPLASSISVEKEKETKNLEKRGLFGGDESNYGDNVYGPPLHISSGVLHLSDESHHAEKPILIHQEVLTHHLPTWHQAPASWPNIQIHHEGEYFPATAVGGKDFYVPAAKPNPNDDGLHTQVVSSNSEREEIDDKVDFINLINGKGKYQIKSYG